MARLIVSGMCYFSCTSSTLVLTVFVIVYNSNSNGNSLAHVGMKNTIARNVHCN